MVLLAIACDHKTIFEIWQHGLIQLPYTYQFTDVVTSECLLLATTEVQYVLDNWADCSVNRVELLAESVSNGSG